MGFRNDHELLAPAVANAVNKVVRAHQGSLNCRFPGYNLSSFKVGSLSDFGFASVRQAPIGLVNHEKVDSGQFILSCW